MYSISKIQQDLVGLCHELFGSHSAIRIMESDPAYGHISTNAVIIDSQINKSDPIISFNKLKSRLLELDYIESAELVNRFCNIRLKQSVIIDNLEQILDMQSQFGMQYDKNPTKVNVEFISANPTGPLHLGHARGIYGDVLANLLEFMGFDVTREYIINNTGHQVEVLGYSVFYQYCKINNLECDEPTESYPGQYIIDIANYISRNKVKSSYNWNNADDRQYFISASVEFMLGLARNELEVLGIEYDVWRYESDVANEGNVENAINILKTKGFIENGVLGEIKGRKGTTSNQVITLLKQSQDDPGKAITKPDGSYTYFAGDIGYYYDKIKRGFKWIICFFGADHDEHANRIRFVARNLDNSIRCDILVFQIVDFKQNGERMKFSKRGGVILRPTDLLEYLPDSNILRFVMVSKRPDTHFSVNLDEIAKISMDNDFYYIQYAYARSCSIIRNAAVFHELNLNRYNLDHYTDSMINLAYKLLRWPDLLQKVTNTLDISILTSELHNLASLFHQIWNQGTTNPEQRWIIADDMNMTESRMRLVLAFQYVLASGFKILGINAYEKMD